MQIKYQYKYTFKIFFTLIHFIFSVYKVLPCTPGAHGGKKRTLDSLELEFQNVVSAHVDAGTEPSPLQEQPVRLTPEPHRYLLKYTFLKLLYYRKTL